MTLEAERLERMRECWREDEPSAFDIARAARRFRERRRARTVGFLSWSIAGASAGLIAMLALAPIPRGASNEPAHGSITAEPLPSPVPAALPEPTIEMPPPKDPAPAKPARAKTPPRERAGSAKLDEPAEPVAKPVHDEATLRGAARWISVGRGPESEPVIRGLDRP